MFFLRVSFSCRSCLYLRSRLPSSSVLFRSANCSFSFSWMICAILCSYYGILRVTSVVSPSLRRNSSYWIDAFLASSFLLAIIVLSLSVSWESSTILFSYSTNFLFRSPNSCSFLLSSSFSLAKAAMWVSYCANWLLTSPSNFWVTADSYSLNCLRRLSYYSLLLRRRLLRRSI